MARTTPSLEDALRVDRAAALRLLPVSRETAERLDAYVALLLRWQTVKNLVGPSTLPTIWTRHVIDSAQIFQYAPDAKIWVDLGSGAGFPGLVIACLLAERNDGHVHLVESNGRKVAFLREIARKLALPVTVHDSRIEECRATLPDTIDCVTARALAPLTELLAMQAQIAKNPCVALFLKGQDIDDELTQASKYWNIKSSIYPSLTDPSGRILLVERAEPWM